MKLICVLGRAGSGKTRYIIHKVGQNKSRALVIVPNQYTLSAEREILKKLGLKGFIDIEVLSFSRLQERVLEITGGALLPVLNNRGKSMILTKLLGENKKSLAAFKAYTNSPSFALSVAEVIAELKRFDIGPDDLNSAAESLRHKELAQIYGLYNEYIKDKYLDSQDKMNLMIQKLSESAFVKDTDVYIDGFEMLTGQIYRVVEALLREAKSVTVTFRLGEKTDDDFHIFGTEYKHYLRIKSIAEKIGAEIEEIRLPQQNAPWGESRNSNTIKHLEKNLFSIKKEKAESSAGIKVICADNMAEEAAICAAEMLRLARDENYRWRDMAVICDNMAEYEPYLKKAFKAHGIPCFLDIKRPVTSHAYSRYILQLIAVIKNNFAARDVISLLKTGFTALEFKECDEYEEQIRTSGLKWLTEKSVFRDSELFDYLKDKLLGGLYVLEKQLRAHNTAAEMAESFYNYLIDSGSVKRLEEFIHSLTENNMLDEAAETTAAYNAVCSVLEQAHEVLSDAKLSVSDFYNIILSGLEAEDSAVIPPNMDSVSLGTLQRSKLSDIRALFILGANEGSFPAPTEENGLISADDKAEFAQKGLYLGHDEVERAAEEELNIYTAVSKPTEKLYIYFALKNARGGEAIPSQNVGDIQSCFETLQIEYISQKTPEEVINTFDSTLLFAVRNISERLQKNKPLGVWKTVRDEYAKAGDFRIERALVSRNAYQDTLPQKLAEKLFSKNYSPSVLEAFASCPFQNFVIHGLKLKGKKEYEYSLKEYGEYYHDALEEFVNSCTKTGWENLTDETAVSLINRICDRLDEKMLRGHEEDAREKHNLSVIRRTLKGVAKAVRMQIQSGLFRPKATEAAFSGEITLEIGEGIRLTGRIDRLDTYERNGRKYIRVVDYKSGNEKFSPTKLYYGTALQLPLYLSAVLTKPELEPAGMFIMPLRENVINETDENVFDKKKIASHKLHGIVLKDSDIILAMDKHAKDGSDILPVTFTPKGNIKKADAVKVKEQFIKILEFGKKKAQELATGIMEGTAEPKPYAGKLNSCQYCLLKGTCGFEKMRGDKARFTRNIKLQEITGENT